MTRTQVLRSCGIAKKHGNAVLNDGYIIRYDDFTKQYSLLSNWKHQTICVTYNPNRIADICADKR